MATIRADLRRVKRLETLLAYHRAALPVSCEEAEGASARRQTRSRLRDEARLMALSIRAGEPVAAAVLARDAALARIEERFRWRFRALAQSRKRFFTRHPDGSPTPFAVREAKLSEARRRALERIRKAYAPEAGADAVVADYRKRAAAVAAQAARRTEAAAAALAAKQTSLARGADRRIARLERRIAPLRLRLARETEAGNVLAERIAPDEILRLDRLSMRFGGLKAVDELSFSVRRGEIFGLIGPNGAGKTTVFNCITRFYRATGGAVYYRDRHGAPLDLADFKVHDVIREGIVRTFQNVELIWELPVLENLLVAAHTRYHTGFLGQLFNVPGLRAEERVMRRKAEQVLTDLGLSAYAPMPVLGLPYGILKKIELARTLMADPALIILDEPAAGLNDAETEQLAETIRRIRDDYHATIFLVEHDMGLVMNVCDRIAAISFGKLLAIGTPKAIQADAAVREAYLGGE